MSPDQDNDVLAMAVESLHLNKFRSLRGLGIMAHGTGRIMSDLASMLAIAHLKGVAQILHIALETDLAEVEDSELIGFSPYSVRMLTPKMLEVPEIMASGMKKEPKHWEKFNKKRKNGRW